MTQANWRKDFQPHLKGKEYMEANCAQCHTAEDFPGTPQVNRGRKLAPQLFDESPQPGASRAETPEYAGIGFLPGQAYMGDVPPELALARRESPRARVPAGSLAIAATMTCIFPRETPCGWHLIGRSPVPLWHERSRALLTPGDLVRFEPVSLREYEGLLAKAADGNLRIVPEIREVVA